MSPTDPNSPAVSSWERARLDVFGITEYSVQHTWFDDAWGSWEVVNEPPDSSPAAASWAPGRLDVFTVGVLGALQHAWYEAARGDWGRYQDSAEHLGGEVVNRPSAVSWGPHRLDVFATGKHNGALNHWWFDGSAWGGPGRPWRRPCREPCCGLLGLGPSRRLRHQPPRANCSIGGSLVTDGRARKRSVGRSPGARLASRGHRADSTSSASLAAESCSIGGSKASGADPSHSVGASTRARRPCHGTQGDWTYSREGQIRNSCIGGTKADGAGPRIFAAGSPGLRLPSPGSRDASMYSPTQVQR